MIGLCNSKSRAIFIQNTIAAVTSAQSHTFNNIKGNDDGGLMTNYTGKFFIWNVLFPSH